MPYFIPLLIKILKLERFECRGLTAGEIALCRPVFGSLIDYSQVKIMNHPYLPWQARHVFMAPCGAIHARAPNYSPDYSTESHAFQGLFIHEMAHIYQYQQNIHVLLRGAMLQSAFFLSFGRYNPYAYPFLTTILNSRAILRGIFFSSTFRILSFSRRPHSAGLTEQPELNWMLFSILHQNQAQDAARRRPNEASRPISMLKPMNWL